MAEASNLVARLRSQAGLRPRDYDCRLAADAAAWIERLERYNTDLSDTVSRCASLLGVSNADAVIAGIEQLMRQVELLNAHPPLLIDAAGTVTPLLGASDDEIEALEEERDQLRASFKNFHRLLCERFGYGHDEVDWQRDQLSLIEWIAKLHPGEGDNRAVSTEGSRSAATVSGTPESYSCSDPRQDARTPAGDGAPSPVLHTDETSGGT